MRVPLSALLLSTLLASCAPVTPEARIRVALTDAGLDKEIAACMAERMVDRLTIAQLRKLSSLSKLREADIRMMSIGEFLHRIRALGDPEILKVVTKAGLGCAIAV